MRGKVIKGSTVAGQPFTVGFPAAALPVEPDAEVPAPLDGDLDAPLHVDRLDAFVADDAAERENAAGSAAQIVADAETAAAALLDDARAAAARIAATARDEAARVVDDARRSAHDEGLAAGRHAAEDDFRDLLATMHDLLDAIRAERRAYIESAEPEVLRLAFGIAERVLHQQVALDPNVVVEMAKAAIARVVDREKMTVRVNPADVARMRAHRDDLLAIGDVKAMRVIEDQRVDRGGVVLETDAGSVDARVSTQVAQVRTILHLVDDVVITGAEPEEPANPARAS